MVDIIDSAGVPFRRQNVAPTRTLGDSGTAVFGGYIQTVEKNAKLTGRERYRTFSEILANTTIVAAGVRYFVNLVARAGWNVEPAAVEGGQQGQAEMIAQTIDDMMFAMETPWHRVVRRAAMYRFYGFSVQEWTAARREDGLVGFADIAPRPQITIERWGLDITGRVLGVWQRSAQTQQEIPIPRAKIVYMVDDTLSDSPEGLGLFRHVVEPANRLETYERLEGFGYETDLRGIPVLRGPFAALEAAVQAGEITAEEKTASENQLISFAQNHNKNPQLALLLDSITYQDTEGSPTNNLQWNAELLEGNTGSNSFEAIGATIERLNREIARVLGVEGLLLGSTRHGSEALARDKSHNFALIIDSTLDEIAEQMEKDFIAPIMRLNGWDMALAPTFKTEPVQYRDIEQITGALRDLAQAGAPSMPGDPAIEQVYNLMGLTAPDTSAALVADASLSPAEGDPQLLTETERNQ